ncbi:MAG: hypothetical protein H3C62_12725 [Gemmatimonadaceae bacterium]|nr:hypothetical protein [Gemmatimonadaceae bacterium]
MQDAAGIPVAWALVRFAGAPPQIADDSGRIALGSITADSIQISVRRIGYRPLDGWVARSAALGSYTVVLPRIALSLDTVRITAAAVMTPLARTGFYDRVARVKKGAINADFITPEELNERNASRLSQILSGRRYTTIRHVMTGRPMSLVLGRGQCAMTVLLDGSRVTNTLQDAAINMESPTSIFPSGSKPKQSGTAIGLDDIVDLNSVMAIEIYPSTANAPAELITLGGRGSCGIVALWTGARR